MNNQNVQVQKVGVGIKIVSIINLVIYSLLLLFGLGGLVLKDQINSQLVKQGVKTVYKLSDFIPIIIIAALIIISVILILLKNMVGVILYFIVCIGNIVFSIIQSGFTSGTLAGLILPVIMAVFIYQKRSIFKIKKE